MLSCINSLSERLQHDRKQPIKKEGENDIKKDNGFGIIFTDF